MQADVTDPAQVAQAVRGTDAVASAYNPGWTHPDLHDEFLRGSRAITAGTKAAGVQRLLVVGGAGSLYVAPGAQLVDTPQFPAEWKNGALASSRSAEPVAPGIHLAVDLLVPRHLARARRAHRPVPAGH